MYPEHLRYSPAHTWVEVEGETARIGITHYAQKQLRDIVFSNIFEDSEKIICGETMGTLESVKSVSDVIAPVNGMVLEMNPIILDNPEIINQDPYGSGFIMKVKIDDMSQIDSLMSASEYQAMIEKL